MPFPSLDRQHGTEPERATAPRPFAVGTARVVRQRRPPPAIGRRVPVPMPMQRRCDDWRMRTRSMTRRRIEPWKGLTTEATKRRRQCRQRVAVRRRTAPTKCAASAEPASSLVACCRCWRIVAWPAARCQTLRRQSRATDVVAASACVDAAAAADADA